MKNSLAKHLRSAAISTGPETHLDHLVPICELMNIPLIVTEERQAQLTREFYPQIKLRLMEPAELNLDFFAAELDVLYGCGKFWAMDLLPLLELLYQKKMRLIFCPHGNSDKGNSLNYQNSFFQDIALIYGTHMRELMGSTRMMDQINSSVEIGNLRLSYYLKHKKHLDLIAKQKIFINLDLTKKTILYSPTWHSAESPSSFFRNCKIIIDQLSENYNLIIKLHPLLEEFHPAETFSILEKYSHENIPALFLREFPAIYPLLERTDLYIGDFSSIGYDFLFYDRPMIFLHPQKNSSSLLPQCGLRMEYSEAANLALYVKKSLQEQQSEFSPLRKKLYEHAFGELKDAQTIRRNIKKKLYELFLNRKNS